MDSPISTIPLRDHSKVIAVTAPGTKVVTAIEADWKWPTFSTSETLPLNKVIAPLLKSRYPKVGRIADRVKAS